MRLAIGGLACLAVGSLFGFLASRSNSAARALPTGRSDQTLRRLEAVLSRLDARLAGLRRAGEIEVEVGPEERESTEGKQELPDSRAKEAVAVTAERSRRLVELSERPPNLVLLQSLNPETVDAKYAFRTYADILVAFGRPDRLYGVQGMGYFDYQCELANGTQRVVTFRFVDGLVFGVSVKPRG